MNSQAINRVLERNYIMNIEQIARVTHATNKVYCESLGDFSQKTWEEAEQWQRDSAVAGVQIAIEKPDITPADLHEEWSKFKLADGWTYGEVKDTEKRTHPCLVPYEQLPVEQQKKDTLFRAIVNALR